MESKRKERLKIIKEKKKKKYGRIRKAIFWVSIIALLITSGFFLKNIYNIYLENKVWEKADKTPLANLEPYMLYLNDDDKKSLKEYNEIYFSSYDVNKNEFLINDEENILKLNKIYEGFNENLKSHLLESHNKINSLWKIKTSYESLLKNEEVSSKTTPSVLQEFITTNWPTLITFLESNESNYFENIYNKIVSISSDTETISLLLEIFNNTFDKTNEGIAVKPNISSKTIKDWEYLTSQLTNDWQLVNKKLTPLITKAKTHLEKHDSAITKHANFILSQEEKTSYDKWSSEYNNLKSQLIDLPDFIDKKKEDVDKWAIDNNINIKYLEKESKEEKETVLEQTPSTIRFNKIIKGTTINITIAKEEVLTTSSSSSSSSISSTSNTSSVSESNPLLPTETRTESGD